jgi:hypothetical protein
VAPHINKFCFASESCIPIVPLRTALRRIYSPYSPLRNPPTSTTPEQADYHSSWVAYINTANNGYAARDQVAARI